MVDSLMYKHKVLAQEKKNNKFDYVRVYGVASRRPQQKTPQASVLLNKKNIHYARCRPILIGDVI